MNILKALVKKKIIDQKQASDIQKEVESTGSSVEFVLDKNGISSDKVAEEKSNYLNIPIADIDSETISKSILEYIPEESAKYYKMIPLRFEDGVLEVGALNPDEIETRDALNFIASKHGITYKLFVITSQFFDKVLNRYRGLSVEVKEALSELEREFEIERGGPEEKDAGVPDIGEKLLKAEGKGDIRVIEDAPVTKIVATILRYAADGSSSDVHIEPMEKDIRVRFRVDGEMNTSLILPTKVHSAVTARIKILSNMKLDEKRKPQDGRFTARIEGRKIDFRVSTFPTYYGEKVVMRILDRDKGVKSLDEIGLGEKGLKTMREAINRPFGIILISGPTGSGKTTTLYSLLQEFDKIKNNVLSLEDPVEYNIDGVSQSQVRDDIGYTFANGLRTILRQDPDIIMVGEIRDKETAQLAIQASLTGHLVLSTIHTNNAIGVIPRLINMGVDPYLIAPTLVLAASQRLVPKLCPEAREEIPVAGSTKALVEKYISELPEEIRNTIEFPKVVYGPGSSSDCPTGLQGRTAIMEILSKDEDIERVIIEDPNELNLEKVAKEKGMMSMKNDALLKALRGEIPFTEVSSF